MSKRRDPASGEVPGLKELIYLAGLEGVSLVCLERRLGFLSDELSGEAKLILESVKGYQSASNSTMYGVPIWKWLPAWLPGSPLRDLMKSKDTLYDIIGRHFDEKIEEDQEVT